MVDGMTQEMEMLGVELVSKDAIVASLDAKLASKDAIITSMLVTKDAIIASKDAMKAIIMRETVLLLRKGSTGNRDKIDITSMFDSMTQEMKKLVVEVASKDARIHSLEARLVSKDEIIASLNDKSKNIMVDGIDKLLLASNPNEAIMEKPDAILRVCKRQTNLLCVDMAENSPLYQAQKKRNNPNPNSYASVMGASVGVVGTGASVAQLRE